MLKHQIIDQNGFFSSAALVDFSSDLQNFMKAQDRNRPYAERILQFQSQRDASPQEQLYLSILVETFAEFSEQTPHQSPNYTIGSHHFVEEMHDIIGRALILDCVGWVSEDKTVQSPLPLKGLEPFISAYQAEPSQTIGNYLAFMGDQHSLELLNSLHAHCATPGMDFPHIALKMPIPYDTIRQVAPDTLRSDHAPFWRKGIPAVFISDTAEFRSNLYHSTADTLDAINFTFLTTLVESLFHFLTPATDTRRAYPA